MEDGRLGIFRGKTRHWPLSSKNDKIWDLENSLPLKFVSTESRNGLGQSSLKEEVDVTKYLTIQAVDDPI